MQLGSLRRARVLQDDDRQTEIGRVTGGGLDDVVGRHPGERDLAHAGRGQDRQQRRADQRIDPHLGDDRLARARSDLIADRRARRLARPSPASRIARTRGAREARVA